MGDLNDPVKDAERIIDVLDKAQTKLRESAQGRVFNVGTKVTYRGKFGVVTDLNQGSEDPTGSTVDLRLEDGSVFEDVSVTSPSLELFRA